VAINFADCLVCPVSPQYVVAYIEPMLRQYFFRAHSNKFVGRMSCLDFEFSKEPMRELERARWRCRRGLLELDIVLQRFMDEHYARLDETELRQFEMLLDLSDNDLWEMIALRKETENRSLQPVLHLLQTI
jgi:antitoxin CptB